MTNTVKNCLDIELHLDRSKKHVEPYWLGLDPSNENIRTRAPHIEPEVFEHFEVRIDEFDIRKHELIAKPGVAVVGDPVEVPVEGLPDHPQIVHAVVLADGSEVILIEEDASMSVGGVPEGIYKVIRLEQFSETE